MKKTLLVLVAGLLIGAGAAAWLTHRPAPAEEKPAAPPAEEKPAAPPAEEHNPLQIPADQRAKSGIILGVPKTEEIRDQDEAYGRAIDPAPLIASAADAAAARVSAEAANRELARVRLLHQQGGNASGQALEAAEAAAATAAIQAKAARARLETSWGPPLAAKLEAGWLDEVLQRGWALARLEVLPGEAPAEMPATLEVHPFPADGPAVPAEVAGALYQANSYLLVLREGKWPIGAGLRAVVPGPGGVRSRLTVPAGAVVYYEGSAWVYVVGEKDNFARRRVVLGPASGGNVAIESGVAAGDRIAVAGAQQLLSSELQAGTSAGGDAD